MTRNTNYRAIALCVHTDTILLIPVQNVIEEGDRDLALHLVPVSGRESVETTRYIKELTVTTNIRAFVQAYTHITNTTTDNLSPCFYLQPYVP